MKFVPVILVAALTACVSPRNAGDYPNGFQLLGHHHYWNKKVGDFLFGSNDPIPDPLAKGYVTTDADGNVYVSKPLRGRLK